MYELKLKQILLDFLIILELEKRDSEEMAQTHVINIDIQDNHEEATIGAFMICDLVTMVTEQKLFFNKNF